MTPKPEPPRDSDTADGVDVDELRERAVAIAPAEETKAWLNSLSDDELLAAADLLERFGRIHGIDAAEATMQALEAREDGENYADLGDLDDPAEAALDMTDVDVLDADDMWAYLEYVRREQADAEPPAEYFADREPWQWENRMHETIPPPELACPSLEARTDVETPTLADQYGLRYCGVETVEAVLLRLGFPEDELERGPEVTPDGG